MKTAVEVFNKNDTSPDLISANGIKFFLAMYSAPAKEVSINNYRYSSLIKPVSRSRPVKLNLLPTTLDAAQQHLFRVSLQVQKWLGNKLNPEEWGWMSKENILWPRKTCQPPASDCLLNIFCNCSKGCGALCGCRRLGLCCSPVCGNCHGTSCLNAEPIEDSSEIETISDAGNQSFEIDATDSLES